MPQPVSAVAPDSPVANVAAVSRALTLLAARSKALVAWDADDADLRAAKRRLRLASVAQVRFPADLQALRSRVAVCAKPSVYLCCFVCAQLCHEGCIAIALQSLRRQPPVNAVYAPDVARLLRTWTLWLDDDSERTALHTATSTVDCLGGCGL